MRLHEGQQLKVTRSTSKKLINEILQYGGQDGEESKDGGRDLGFNSKKNSVMNQIIDLKYT